MDEEIERLIVSVRADTAGFARDVAEMRGQLDGPLGEGAERAGRALEMALARAVRTGKLGFDDLRRMAAAAMADIANAAIRGGIGAVGGGSQGGGLTGLLLSLLGAPGRATGGSVAPGRAYRVGENGPELFVPTTSGRVEAHGGGGREVRISIRIDGSGASDPQALAQSSRQVARAVKAALSRVDD